MPKIAVALEISRFSLSIDEDQLQDLVLLTDNLARFSHQQKYLRFRPAEERSVRSAGRSWAPAWWTYAIRCVSHDVKQRRACYSWSYLADRRDKRLQYKAAYRDLLESKKSPTRLVEMLQSLESKMEVSKLVIKTWPKAAQLWSDCVEVVKRGRRKTESARE